MKRRNVDVSKLRRPLVRRGRMSEDIYGRWVGGMSFLWLFAWTMQVIHTIHSFI